jgi:hypothetical protein
MLKSLEGASVLGEDVLERLEEAHAADRPPEDPWRER